MGRLMNLCEKLSSKFNRFIENSGDGTIPTLLTGWLVLMGLCMGETQGLAMALILCGLSGTYELLKKKALDKTKYSILGAAIALFTLLL